MGVVAISRAVSSGVISPNRKTISVFSEEIAASAPPPVNDEARSQWLSNFLLSNPDILSLRERTRPLIGGHSFANITHTYTVTSPEVAHRHAVLELISDHL
jgi:hypothetical protein